MGVVCSKNHTKKADKTAAPQELIKPESSILFEFQK